MRNSFSNEIRRDNENETERYLLKKIRLALESASAHLADVELWSRQTKSGASTEILRARDSVGEAFRQVRESLGEDVGGVS